MYLVTVSFNGLLEHLTSVCTHTSFWQHRQNKMRIVTSAFLSYPRDHISVCPLNKVVWSPWPGIQHGSKHRNLRYILFNRSRQCFYPGESSPDSLSEAPLGLKYCLVVLKKSCSGALCQGALCLFSHWIPLKTVCVCIYFHCQDAYHGKSTTALVCNMSYLLSILTFLLLKWNNVRN